MHYYDLGLLEPKLEAKALSLGWARAAAPQRIVVETQADLKKVPRSGVALASGKSGEVLKKLSSRDSQATLLVDAFSVPNFFKDDGLIRSVADAEKNGCKIAFAVPYAYLLRSSFVYRARFVSQTRIFLSKCLKLGAPFVVVSGAQNEFELKSPREAIALCELLGLSFEQAQKALSSVPQKLIEK